MANIDLFSYFPGLEVSTDEVMRAELLAYQVLSARFPDMDLREGTAIRDMVIRPNATLLALINKALLFYFDQNTVTGVTNSTAPAFVDKLMSNWFISRKQGNNSIINVRLFFSKSKNVTVYPDAYFSTNGVLKFFPEAVQVYSSENLTYDSTSNQWYIDVDLIAEKAGSAYDITTGSLLYFTNFDPYFMHGEINYLKSNSIDIESNLDFIARTKSAISTRNLINVPSIISNLLENFSYIDDMIINGFGDPGMIRDKILVLVENVLTPIWIHNGGCVDIYCRTGIESSIIQFTLDSSGKLDLTGAIYNVERSLVTGGNEEDTLPPKAQVITNMSWLTGELTITIPDNGYIPGNSITITGVTTVACNGTYSITSVIDTDIFKVTHISDPGVITLGTSAISTLNNDYTISYPHLIVKDVSGITASSGIATATVDNHGLEVDERVLISGAGSPLSEYSGVRKILEVPTIHTFTYEVEPTVISPAAGSDITISYPSRAQEVGFSERQSMILDFGSNNASKTVSLIVHFFKDIDSIDGYLKDKVNRVLCADLLARGFNTSFLDFTVTAYTGLSPDSQVCATIIESYLAGLAPGQPFIMSDLLSHLYSGGITTIKTPLTVSFNKYWKDGLGNTSGVITDILNPEDPLNVFVLNSVTTNFEAV